MRAWTPGIFLPMQASSCPRPLFTPVSRRIPDPDHLTPFPQRLLFEKKQRLKRQEPLMVQANPDAFLRFRRPWQREERLAGDSGEKRFLGSGRIVGLEGENLCKSGVCVSEGRGLNGLEGRSLAEPWSRDLVEHWNRAPKSPSGQPVGSPGCRTDASRGWGPRESCVRWSVGAGPI